MELSAQTLLGGSSFGVCFEDGGIAGAWDVGGEGWWNVGDLRLWFPPGGANGWTVNGGRMGEQKYGGWFESSSACSSCAVHGRGRLGLGRSFLESAVDDHGRSSTTTQSGRHDDRMSNTAEAPGYVSCTFTAPTFFVRDPEKRKSIARGFRRRA